MPIRFHYLLAIYIFVPLFILAMVIDQMLFSGDLQRILPATPEQTYWYALLFGLPHIVASELTLLRRDYLKSYRGILFLFISIALTASLFVNHVLSERLAYAVFIVWTMIHVIGQQIGLSRINLHAVNWAFVCWKWSLISSICLIMLIFSSAEITAQTPMALKVVTAALFISSHLFFYLVVDKARNRFGFWYALATHLMVITAVMSFVMEYSFLAILLPRVIHDVTAFMFYCTHEYNRNTETADNSIIQSLGLNTKFIFIVVPMVAIGLAYFFNQYFAPEWVLTLIFLHYLLESKIWKHGSPHRQHIRFT